jgi:hypothetical protein
VCVDGIDGEPVRWDVLRGMTLDDGIDGELVRKDA